MLFSEFLPDDIQADTYRAWPFYDLLQFLREDVKREASEKPRGVPQIFKDVRKYVEQNQKVLS